MTEDSGRILEALDHLDPALIEDMDGQATVKRRSTPMRVVLAAACVGVLLVVAVVAAEVVKGGFMRIYRGTGENSNVFYFGADGDIERIPVENLSPELQSLADLYRDEAFHMEHLGFDSWEEAEDFLGRNIMDNPLLTGGGYLPNGVTYEGEHTEGNCVVSVVTDYGVIRRVDVDAQFSLEPEGSWGSPWVEVEVSIYVEQNFEGTPLESAVNEAEPSPEETEYTPDPKEYVTMEPENYRTANDLEATIFDLPFISKEENTEESGYYYGFVFLHGVQVRVSRHYSGQEGNKEMALSILKQVLDAFE